MGMKGEISLKWNSKKMGLAVVISNNIDFKRNSITKNKKGQYILIKGSIQEDITIINIYSPNIRAPQNIRHLLTAMKEEYNSGGL